MKTNHNTNGEKKMNAMEIKKSLVVSVGDCTDGFGGKVMILDSGENVRCSVKLPVPAVGDIVTVQMGSGRFKILMHVE